MKKEFIAPTITKVVNDEVMAEVCNEQFIYTSAGGASNGYAKVCYHFPKIEMGVFVSISSNNDGGNGYSTAVVNLPKGCTFVQPKRAGEWTEDGIQYSITTEIPLGWGDFEGTNGNCHFVGFIYDPSGVLMDRAYIKAHPEMLAQ